VAIRPPPRPLTITTPTVRLELVELRAFAGKAPAPGDWTVALWLPDLRVSWLVGTLICS